MIHHHLIYGIRKEVHIVERPLNNLVHYRAIVSEFDQDSVHILTLELKTTIDKYTWFDVQCDCFGFCECEVPVISEVNRGRILMFHFHKIFSGF